MSDVIWFFFIPPLGHSWWSSSQIHTLGRVVVWMSEPTGSSLYLIHPYCALCWRLLCFWHCCVVRQTDVRYSRNSFSHFILLLGKRNRPNGKNCRRIPSPVFKYYFVRRRENRPYYYFTIVALWNSNLVGSKVVFHFLLLMFFFFVRWSSTWPCFIDFHRLVQSFRPVIALWIENISLYFSNLAPLAVFFFPGNCATLLPIDRENY